MPRTAAATKAIADAPNPATDRPVSPLTESRAAEIMWVYYRDRKTQLISDIKDYRASILAALMQGAPRRASLRAVRQAARAGQAPAPRRVALSASARFRESGAFHMPHADVSLNRVWADVDNLPMRSAMVE
jgi:hypothetical protein